MTTKQTAVVAALVAGRPDVTFEQQMVDKTMMLVAAGWPVVTVGANGGVVVGVRSYPENGKDKTAFSAALIGDQLLAKQVARDAAKKAAAEKKTEVVEDLSRALMGEPIVEVPKKEEVVVDTRKKISRKLAQ